MRRGWRRSGAAMLLACLPAVALAASAPAWITAFPHDPDAYVGIGRADKRQHPARYREVAQVAALSQISREISVSLRAEESLARREDGAGWEESWSQSLRADSRSDLTGYRLVEVHETGTDYWVYYALDKEEHVRQVEFRLSGQVESLEALLAARALPEALRRLEALDPGDGPVSEARRRYESLAERIRSSARNSTLVLEPEKWTWDPWDPADRVRVRLRDGRDGKDWKGAVRLRFRAPGVHAKSCELETDGEGRFHPAPLLLECRLEPGSWRVIWLQPGSNRPMGPEAAVEARIRARTWALDVRAVPAGLIPWQEAVATELAALPSPYFRIRKGGEAREDPRLEIRLVTAEADSLDDLHFATLRGTLRLPDGTAQAVTGKGGHADRAKARDRAVRDFAGEVGKRLSQRP